MNESRCDERLKARVERVTDGFQVYLQQKDYESFFFRRGKDRGIDGILTALTTF
jgi:hypothetical protein